MIKQTAAALIAAGILFTACQGNQSQKAEPAGEPATETAQAMTQDLAGTYKGTIPCADCAGIEQALTLNADNSFELLSIYKGKGDEKPLSEKGTYMIENGMIVLDIQNQPAKYLVGDGYLEQLDMEGKPINSDHNYKLTKQ